MNKQPVTVTTDHAIPAGTYSGSWSGDELTLDVGSDKIKLNTTIGVRGWMTVNADITSDGGKRINLEIL